MLTTFDVCVAHLATLYFGLVTISGVARSQRLGMAKLRVSGGLSPSGVQGLLGVKTPKAEKTLRKFSTWNHARECILPLLFMYFLKIQSRK